MSGAANVNFDVTNLTAIASVTPSGIIFVQGQSKRGEFSNPSEIINGWPRFVELYGGLSPNFISPLLVKRYLEKGGKMRFSRLNSADNTKSADNAVQSFTGVISFTDEPVANETIKIDGPNSSDLNITYTTLGEYYDVMETYIMALPNYVSHRRVKNQLSSSLPDDIYIYTKVNTPLNVDQSTASISYDDLGNSFEDITGTKQLLKVGSKYAGSDYNNIRVDVLNATNGNPSLFNIQVVHTIEPTINELYSNLSLDNVVSTINTNSNLINVSIPDGTTIDNLTQINKKSSTVLNGGTEPILEPSDYIGDSATKTGFFAFDDYEDSYYLTTFDQLNATDRTLVDVAAISYINNRQDLIYPVITEGINKEAIIDYYQTKFIDSKYAFPLTSGGGLKVLEPLSNTEINISPIADVLAAAVNSDTKNGPWFSFAGPNRGIITNTLGVVTNFGTQSKIKDLNELADNNINTVIVRDNSVKLWGNYSGQLLRNQERYLNIVKLVIFLKRALRPILEPFLEEPNDITTWQSIYYSVQPLLESLKNRRAIYSYNWSGDQFAKSMDDLVVNKKTDVTQGKYKVLLAISGISSLQEINVGIFLTEAGLEFSVIENQLNN